MALLDSALTGLPIGGLNADRPAEGVRVLRSGLGRGYLGPEPIKGHGPHRYARPKAVLAAITGPSLARGRPDGLHER